jgi:hypothetical protein
VSAGLGESAFEQIREVRLRVRVVERRSHGFFGL